MWFIKRRSKGGEVWVHVVYFDSEAQALAELEAKRERMGTLYDDFDWMIHFQSVLE